MRVDSLHHFDNDFLLEVIDGSSAHMYIMDPDTYEILYMNEAIRREFHLSDSAGQICWKVLQRDMDGPCDFCSIPKLLEGGEQSYFWNELNSVTGRIYQNFDRIVKWNGRSYFIRCASDVTDLVLLSKDASHDDLTAMFNRRAGQQRLEELLAQAREEKEVLSLVLCDLNELKQVNDMYGHLEGDKVLRYFADVIKSQAEKGDLFFRLSGDEFILAYYGKGKDVVEERIQNLQYCLWAEREKNDIFYSVSCSCGAVTIKPENHYTLNELIAIADQRMYEQKRKYHIQREKEKLFSSINSKTFTSFNYNKDKLYEAISESTDEYVFVGNLKTGVFRYPPAMVKEFGLPGEVLNNASAFWARLIHPHDETRFLESNQEIADGRTEQHDIEYRAKNVKGEWIWLRCRGKMIRDENGEADLFAGMITNRGENHSIDQLTGLHNRFSFENTIKRHLDANAEQSLCIVVLDIDGFKNINSLYDPAFGDEILRITARKLQHMLPPEARLFRLDGARYGALFPGSREDAGRELFSHIQKEFCRQQEYNGRKYFYTISAGCVIYPEHGRDYLELLKRATNSLEYSKIRGKNRITVFSSQIVKGNERKLAMSESLRACVENNFEGFSVVFQPQVEVKTGRIYGAEALSRWHNDQFGNVSPLEFIPLMEQNGMISALGRWVFKEAAQCCKKWCSRGHDLRMSVNFSYPQLLDVGLDDYLRNVLEEIDLEPERMILELTESYLVRNDEVLMNSLQHILDIGIQLALDDFGTGYSSLLSLSTLPATTVKIDRIFAKDIDTNVFNNTSLKTVTDLCHGIGKAVCLEGVETEEQSRIAREKGVELVQGFYYGYPETEEEFSKKYLDESEN